jgi:hypothetical protein
MRFNRIILPRVKLKNLIIDPHKKLSKPYEAVSASYLLPTSLCFFNNIYVKFAKQFSLEDLIFQKK